MIDTMHLYIIAFVSVVGLSLVSESAWRGVCYFIFAVAAIAFWVAFLITIGALPWTN